MKAIKKSCENQALKGAKVIVAAGRGMKEKENLEFVFKFAKYFSSSAVGASRPLVDMGWIGYEHQVGVTGAVVAPELYIACGISGSSQHIAGMKDAGLVVSINKNPAAPLFFHSDLCIIEDALEFIPAFLKKAGESFA
jgi:electron transfer flavoprotein alpha subunit